MSAVTLSHRLFDSYRYGIVDASLREELPGAWKQEVIAPKFLGDDTGRCPVLIDLGALAIAERGSVLDLLESQSSAQQNLTFSLLLECEGDSQRLAAHLAQRLQIQTELGGRPMQFRFFDPGTFLQLPMLFAETGMAWLLGPVTSVMVCWAGEWSRYERPSVLINTNFSVSSLIPDLLMMGAINRAASQLPSVADQYDWLRRCQRIRGHVSRAMQMHRLVDRDDLVAFAIQAETRHPNFDQHRTLLKILTELANAKPEDEVDYRELTSRLSLEDWQQIAADLSAHMTEKGNKS